MVGFIQVDDQYILYSPRHRWMAEPALSLHNRLRSPVSYVRVTHTGAEYSPHYGDPPAASDRLGQRRCSLDVDCIRLMHDLHRSDVGEMFFVDIAFNFYISDSGTVYEGRGWMAESDQGMQGRANPHFVGDCLDICYLGDFTQADPPWEMQKAMVNLIQYGVKFKWIKPSFSIHNLKSESALPLPF